MPTYVYRREDGTTFEMMQRITEDPLAVCPTTGQPVKRVIGAGAGLIFKGDGFYLTDYARKKTSPASAKGEDTAAAGSTTNGTSAKKETESSSKKTDSAT